MPKGAFAPVDLHEYGNLMTAKYEELYPYPDNSEDSIDLNAGPAAELEVDIRRLEALAKDTFLTAAYLPCHHDHEKKQTLSGHKVEVVIKHPEVSHVDVLCLPEIPKTKMNKHLSLHTMKTSYKPIKKVKRIRQFVRAKSVFADWQIDTPAIVEEAFSLDA